MKVELIEVSEFENDPSAPAGAHAGVEIMVNTDEHNLGIKLSFVTDINPRPDRIGAQSHSVGYAYSFE